MYRMTRRLLLATTAALTILTAAALCASCAGRPAPRPAAGTGARAEGSREPSDETPGETPVETPAESPAPTEAPTEAPPETPTEAPTEDYFEAHRVERVTPDPERVPDMSLTGAGCDLYQLPADSNWGYRYGCTYLYNEDGSVDAYFSSPGAAGEWDWIAYRHSPDDGATWEDERVVLTPTQGSMDAYSCCDPGVVRFNGYYYLGYTSTLNGQGACNNVFVARSKRPDGPFEKWNGHGWGGYDPQPILYYDQNYAEFGIGEPSFVELNGTLYLYYSELCPAGTYTMAATADARDENWPASLTFHGAAVRKDSDTDSMDIKYVEEFGKFVGVATSARMGPASYLSVYESNDGLRFRRTDAMREGAYAYLHNAGLSSRPDGHIRLSEDADRLRVVYAYGTERGLWNTRSQPVSLQLADGAGIDRKIAAEREKDAVTGPFVRGVPVPRGQRGTVLVRADRDVYVKAPSSGAFRIGLCRYDSALDKGPLKRSEELSFSDYDPSVVSLNADERTATPVGVGETSVTVRAGNGLVSVFHISITEGPTAAQRLEPVSDARIYIGERGLYHPQLRARVRFEGGAFREVFVDDYNGQVSFTGYDARVIRVSDRGIVTALSVGETEVTMTLFGGSVVLRVAVTDDPADAHFKEEAQGGVDFACLDFSKPETVKVLTGVHNATLSWEDGALCARANQDLGDPFFTVLYSQSEQPLSAEAYGKFEITYMVPPTVAKNTRSLQLFLCAGDDTTPSEARSVLREFQKDGEYHTLTVDLSGLPCWKGNINMIRVDFFTSGYKGDAMYVRSIRLIP